jgi:hypothetical protein
MAIYTVEPHQVDFNLATLQSYKSVHLTAKKKRHIHLRVGLPVQCSCSERRRRGDPRGCMLIIKTSTKFKYIQVPTHRLALATRTPNQLKVTKHNRDLRFCKGCVGPTHHLHSLVYIENSSASIAITNTERSARKSR